MPKTVTFLRSIDLLARSKMERFSTECFEKGDSISAEVSEDGSMFPDMVRIAWGNKYTFVNREDIEISEELEKSK